MSVPGEVHAAFPMAFRVPGGLLARNTALNLVGELVAVATALLAVPLILGALGVERFGLLSLVWIILGNIAVFDLGLGRATTKLAAEALATQDDGALASIVWTAAATQALIAAATAAAFAGLAPLLVRHVLGVRPDLIADAEAALWITALAIPLVSLSTSFAAVLEAAQRFDWVNAVRIPSIIATFATPLAASSLGLGLPGVVGFLVLARLAGLVAFAAASLRLVPPLRRPVSPRLDIAARLCRFGGWVAVAQVTAPFLRYLDRYIVGAVLSLAAVAYYSAPFDMMDRLWMISSSLALTLFPAFSALTGSGDVPRAQTLFCRSVRYLVLAQCPVVLVVTAYAGPILRLWLGPDFAEHGTLALQLLGLAWIFGALAPVPASLLDGYGRPDLLAKLYLVALPLNTAFTWLFVQTMGLPGAALWVAIRAVLQTATLVIMAGRLLGLRPAGTVAALAHPIGTIWGTALAIGLFTSLPATEPLRAALLGGLLTVFASAAWRWVLDPDDRRLLQALRQRAHP